MSNSKTMTNQSVTSSSNTQVNYTVNNKKINAEKISHPLTTPTGAFDIVVNNVKIHVSEAVSNVKITKAGVNIRF